MRLACVKHSASVRSEPGSNSQVHHPYPNSLSHQAGPTHPIPIIPQHQPRQAPPKITTQGSCAQGTQTHCHTPTQLSPGSANHASRHHNPHHPQAPIPASTTAPGPCHQTKITLGNIHSSLHNRCNCQTTQPRQPAHQTFTGPANPPRSTPPCHGKEQQQQRPNQPVTRSVKTPSPPSPPAQRHLSDHLAAGERGFSGGRMNWQWGVSCR